MEQKTKIIDYATYREHIEKLSYAKKLFYEKDKARLESFRKYITLKKEVDKMRNDIFNLIPDWK